MVWNMQSMLMGIAVQLELIYVWLVIPLFLKCVWWLRVGRDASSWQGTAHQVSPAVYACKQIGRVIGNCSLAYHQVPMIGLYLLQSIFGGGLTSYSMFGLCWFMLSLHSLIMVIYCWNICKLTFTIQ